MPEYDFFELTGVSLEEDKPANVKSAISHKEKELGESMSTSDQSKRREAEAQLKFLRAKRDELFGSNGNFKSSFSAMVKARTAELKKRLEIRVKIEAATRSSRVVTKGKIKSIRNNKAVSGGLPLKDIEDVYTANGFRIEDIAPSAHMPKFPANIESIYRELDELRERVHRDMAINPSRNSADNVRDLYSFVSYISGGNPKAKTCRHYQAQKLKEICEAYQRKYTGYNSGTIEKLAANIAGQAASHVFDSEEHRKGYEQYILYTDSELQKLFAVIRDLSDADKRDPYIADYFIREINSVFTDYNTALAIYNSEARMLNDPYEPQQPIFTVKCSHCHAVCEFTSLEEAQRLNKCTNCGEKLYKKCPKGHYVLLSDKKCPDCGYSFPDAEKFAEFSAMAEAEIKRGNFEKARDFLRSATIADPEEKAKIKSLEKQISKAEKEFNAPIDKLSTLIKERKFFEASVLADSLAVSRNDDSFIRLQSKINSVLSECKKDFSSAPTQIGKVNACYDILERCRDFKPAIDFLASCEPMPCAFLKASADDERLAITLTWPNTGERGITYTLVRRKSAVPPDRANDGDIILSGSSKLSYRDERIEPGIIYSYSIFTYRQGLYSQPKSISASVMPPVSEINHIQNGHSIFLSWTVPGNCSGVSVSQKSEGAGKLLNPSAEKSIAVEGLEFGRIYSFLLTAKYPAGCSRRVGYDVTLTPEIKPFTITAAKVSDNLYRFSWSITESGAEIQILSGHDVIASARSEMRSCQVRLKSDTYHVIKARTLSCGNMLFSKNEVRLNTFSACEIDDSRTAIEETEQGKVHISLIPSVKKNDHLKNFAYFVRTNESWGSENDVISRVPDCNILSADSVMKKGCIDIEIDAGDEESYCVTVFALYKSGEAEIISQPWKRLLQRPLKVNVFVSVSRSFFSGIKFNVRVEANRPLKRWPGFVVCISSDGGPLLSHTDPNAVTVLDVEEKIYPVQTLQYSFDIKRNIPRGEKLYMFWKDIKQGENFVFRWDSGFNGTA